MSLFFKILLVLVLSSIAYQDIKSRMVDVILFPICALLFSILSFLEIGYEFFTEHVPFNLLFITIYIAASRIFIRHYYDFSFSKSPVGEGDYIMFFTTCFALSSIAFVWFFLISYVTVIGVHMSLKWLRGSTRRSREVPVAGYMAIFYGVLFSFHWISGINSFYN